MQHFCSNIEMLPLTVLFILLLIYLYLKWTYGYWSRRKVLSPPPFIPFGNIPAPVKSAKHVSDTIEEYYQEAKLRKLPYFGIYFLTRPVLVIVDPEIIKLVMIKDFATFSERPFFSNEKNDPISTHLFSLNGKKWYNLRAKLTPTFTAAKIKAMFTLMTNCAENMKGLVNDFCEAGEVVELKALFSRFTIDVITSCSFGYDAKSLKSKEATEVYKHCCETFNFDTLRNLKKVIGQVYPKVARLLGLTQVPKATGQFFLTLVDKIVEERRQSNIHRNDVLALLMNIKKLHNDENEKDFTKAELAAQCFVFFVAGYETAASTMMFAIYEIVKNPEVEMRLREEIGTILEQNGGKLSYDCIMQMKYLNKVVKETLRRRSPAYFVTRQCVTDYCIPNTNFKIEKGLQLLIPIHSIHMDPDHYKDPLCFNPDRFDQQKAINNLTYLAFGEGPRNCIGMRFGLLVVKLGLIYLLKNFKLTLNPKTQEPLQKRVSSLLNEALGGIWMNVERLPL